jgi:hypothetical protein
VDSPPRSQHRLRWLLPIAFGLVSVAGVAVLSRGETPVPSWRSAEPERTESVRLAATSSVPIVVTSSSAQPKITWSQTGLELTLSPSESTTRDLTFSSSLAFTNAVLEAVPAIAGFVSLQPISFSTVPAGQPQAVHLSFAVPTGAALGTYDGTVRVTVGNRTLPQALKVTLNVWQRITEPASGVSFSLPPRLAPTAAVVQLTARMADGRPLIDVALPSPSDAAYISQFELILNPNPNDLGLTEWFRENVDPDNSLLPAGVFAQQRLANGMETLVQVGSIPDIFTDQNGPIPGFYVISPSGSTVVVLSPSQVNELDLYGYSGGAKVTLLLDILGTLLVP